MVRACLPCDSQVPRSRHTSTTAAAARTTAGRKANQGATTAARGGSKSAAAAPGAAARGQASSRQQAAAGTTAAAGASRKRAAPGFSHQAAGTAGTSAAQPTASKGGRLAAMATSSRLTHGMHRWADSSGGPWHGCDCGGCLVLQPAWTQPQPSLNVFHSGCCLAQLQLAASQPAARQHTQCCRLCYIALLQGRRGRRGQQRQQAAGIWQRRQAPPPLWHCCHIKPQQDGSACTQVHQGAPRQASEAVLRVGCHRHASNNLPG